MKTSFVKHTLTLLVLLCSIATTSQAQTRFYEQALSMSIKGTSTLHDWEMKSEKGDVEAAIDITSDKITFSSLTFTMPANTLKSGHGMMDKNTYKALNTSKNPSITFSLKSANITPAGNNTYNFRGLGNLTIAGTTHLTDLVATLKYNPLDKTFTCIGSKKFKMTDYGVKPPTVMMGTIKTGDDISISYNLKIKG